ncbi:YceH family protein [Curvibacter sp. APW13]|uniref:YceH family protein n=1 Tax=Curvibacter sp. APW13 TaxID=3077236 RepID=UPI0028DF38E6|nr:YceH family protein [Curvibacter sp. APW13]MDT8992353.1 YceH family protein [Curvibacter sp. APW13]
MTEPTPPTPSLLLTPVEARVVATLMEKARTVPDSYPLSVNALLLGCNQKTSRDPVMELSEADVMQALEELRDKNLVREVSGARVPRFEHNFQRGAGVFEQAAVLLGLLMLRGHQTAAELRLNAERWYRFADVSSVEGFLEELQERSAEKGGPLVVKLPKAPGAREARWAHLLCGAVDASAPGSGSGAGGANQARIEALEAEVAQLRATVALLCKELGVSPPGQDE